MKKYFNLPLTFGLVVWFTTAIYLSINSVISLFVKTEPYIAKSILSFSFIWLVVFGVINYKKRGDIFDASKEPKSGCKTCKQR